MDAPSLATGTVVDHYEVIRRIGRGGMGEVYLARDLRLGRRVALKRVRPEILGDAAAAARFLVEAQVTARLAHPHVVTIYGVGEHEGAPYLALEYVEGESLRERMLRRPPAAREAIRLLLAVADAVRAAHAAGVLHRDLKPENVILARDGRPRVVNFGLAKAVNVAEVAGPRGGGAGPHDTAETSVRGLETTAVALPGSAQPTAGLVQGTPLYMAPEQWLARPATGKTDVWALGVVLYELLAGALPFPGTSTLAICAQVCAADLAPALPAACAPGPILELVAACLAKEPAARPDAEAVHEALAAALADRPRDVSLPFRGLLPFAESDAGLFYGRDAEIAEVAARLDAEPTLAVVGPSGAGKSSFVHAGLVPRLREQGRCAVVSLRPGRAPFAALAAALGRGAEAAALAAAPGQLALLLAHRAAAEGGRLLLVVDQLEEAYTLVDDAAERRRFLESVCLAADDPLGPVRVVLTLRDDFLGRLAETAAARAALERTVVLRTPPEESLRDALLRPVAAAGHRWEDAALVDEIVAAVRGEAAGLPLLQFVAASLWTTRNAEQRVLRRAAYVAMGGVSGALAGHADGLLAGLPPERQDLVRLLLLRLVTSEGTRRVTTRPLLLAGLPDGAAEVLDRLARDRLVTCRQAETGDAEVELVHESLIRGWGRLRRWLDEGREGLAALAELEPALAGWRRHGDVGLWRGDALADARRRLQGVTVPPAVAAFLDASLAAERRRVRRRRATLGAAAALLAAVAAVLAVQNHQVRGARAAAESGRRLAESARGRAEHSQAAALREGAAASLGRGDVVAARARLRAALEIEDSLESRALWWRLGAEPRRAHRQLSKILVGASYSPDGARLAVAANRGPVFVLDAGTLDIVATAPLLRGALFLSAGRLLGGTDDGACVWDLGLGRCLTRFPGADATTAALAPGGGLAALAIGDAVTLVDPAGVAAARRLDAGAHVRALAFSPDGRVLASAGEDGVVRLLDVATGAARATLRGHAGPVWAVAWSADGRTLATGGFDKTVRLWTAEGAPGLVLAGHGEWVRSLVFAGAVLASGSNDGTVRLWDVASGRLERVLDSDSALLHVDLSPDGRSLAGVTWGGSTTVWDVAAALRPPLPERGHPGVVNGLAFAPDGASALTASTDGVLRRWDAATGAELGARRGHDASVTSVAVSPDGRRVVTTARDRTLVVWDAAALQPLERLNDLREWPVRAAWSPDGATLALALNDGTVSLRDTVSFREARALRGHERGGANDVSFSADGRSLASGGDDATVRVWDLADGTARVLRGHAGPVHGAALSADGRRVISASTDGTVRLWDVASGAGAVVNRCEGAAWHVAWHPDMRRAAVACADGTTHVLAVDGGEPRRLRGHVGSVQAVAFSRDGALLASSGADGSIRLWDLASGEARWRAPLLLARPPALWSQRGWELLGDGPLLPPGAWRAAVMGAALGDAGDDGLVCLVAADGALEVWDRGADTRRERRDASAPATAAAAFPGGCAFVAGGKLVVLPPRSGWPAVGDASALGLDRASGELLVAAGDAVLACGEGCHRLGAAGTTPSAVGRAGAWLAVGHGDGGVTLLGPRPAPDLADLPPGSPTAMAAGPAGTLVVGFGGGAVGLWSPESGARLLAAHLHGPVRRIASVGSRVYAASDLGDTLVLDLDALVVDRCRLLAAVAREVPVVWDAGAIVRRAAPACTE